jgi:hypothetical protein
MKKLLLGLMVGATAMVGSAHASYTECTVQKDTATVNRPGGHSMPRWTPLKKGDTVAIMDTYPLSARESGVVKPIQHYDWIFIFHREHTASEYGWVPANVLVNCQPMEGTP